MHRRTASTALILTLALTSSSTLMRKISTASAGCSSLLVPTPLGTVSAPIQARRTSSLKPSASLFAAAASPPTGTDSTPPTSAYDFTVNDAKHKPFPLSSLRGKVTLVMNTASQCGYTQNGYSVATELYERYKDKGFTVLAFPCNQFGAQEPGSEEEITNFVCTRFQATFPIMEKVDVNGPNAHPFWEYLKNAQPGIFGTTSIKWNFTVFLVDKKGRVVERLSPGAKVADLEEKIVALLNAPE